jgi:hypothetical protein
MTIVMVSRLVDDLHELIEELATVGGGAIL